VERLDIGPCSYAKYALTWSLYGTGTLLLWHFVRSAGLPDALSWIGALLMALAVLSWTS
jgi:hypothetical protein